MSTHQTWRPLAMHRRKGVSPPSISTSIQLQKWARHLDVLVCLNAPIGTTQAPTGAQLWLTAALLKHKLGLIKALILVLRTVVLELRDWLFWLPGQPTIHRYTHHFLFLSLPSRPVCQSCVCCSYSHPLCRLCWLVVVQRGGHFDNCQPNTPIF